MVHTKTESFDELTWIRNISYDLFPPRLLVKLKDPFTQIPLDVSHFAKLVPWMNRQENLWNSVAVDKEENIRAIMWGLMDPITFSLQVLYLSADRGLNIAKSARQELLSLGEKYSVSYIYFFSHRWNTWKRLMPQSGLIPCILVEVH